jgi:hypothetical protein
MEYIKIMEILGIGIIFFILGFSYRGEKNLALMQISAKQITDVVKTVNGAVRMLDGSEKMLKKLEKHMTEINVLENIKSTFEKESELAYKQNKAIQKELSDNRATYKTENRKEYVSKKTKKEEDQPYKPKTKKDKDKGHN